ncbi:MAG: hypothetical protein QW175_07860 [Candidatus Bathyarchaeia archaeon]
MREKKKSRDVVSNFYGLVWYRANRRPKCFARMDLLETGDCGRCEFYKICFKLSFGEYIP